MALEHSTFRGVSIVGRRGRAGRQQDSIRQNGLQSLPPTASAAQRERGVESCGVTHEAGACRKALMPLRCRANE